MIPPRQAVRDSSPYAVPKEGRLGAARLDFNENTAGFPEVVGLPGLSPEQLSSYPEYEALLAALSAYCRLPADHLLLCNGVDDALSVLAATYIEAGDGALTSRPTYTLIPYFLCLYGARLVEVPTNADLSFDLHGIGAALVAEPIKIALFASPDNPSGAVLDAEFIGELCARHRETLFVIDEAYGEYSPASSLLPEVGRRDNLLVLRTFSKAWGLAGLRLGYIAGPPSVLSFLRRVRLPFSVNAAAVQAALRLLPEAPRVLAGARATMARKADLIGALAARGYATKDGAANFFLLAAGDQAAALCEGCRARGVLLRDRSQVPETRGMIRVSVGTADENAALLRALDELSGREASP